MRSMDKQHTHHRHTDCLHKCHFILPHTAFKSHEHTHCAHRHIYNIPHIHTHCTHHIHRHKSHTHHKVHISTPSSYQQHYKHVFTCAYHILMKTNSCHKQHSSNLGQLKEQNSSKEAQYSNMFTSSPPT